MTGGTAARAEAAAVRLEGRARRNVPLGPLTTYRVGGLATVLVEPADEEELDALAEAVGATGTPVLAVGKGSNMLVSDDGFPGVVVVLGDAFGRTELLDDPGTTGSGEPGVTPGDRAVRVKAGGAASLPVVARRSVREGLTGFEWAVGVPGTIGGAVRMNAGGHGSDMAACVLDATILDLLAGERRVVPATSLAFGYRRSAVAPHHLVVSATLGLSTGDPAAGERALAEIVAWRRAHQPGGPNAGSVFTNPPGDSAGRLIDAAGCKGLRVGTAEVSPKHANFIQADKGGSADDVAALMAEVRRRVLDHAGVELHAETKMVGFPAEVVLAAGADAPAPATRPAGGPPLPGGPPSAAGPVPGAAGTVPPATAGAHRAEGAR